ncbi:MAG: FHA domain-containing protein [Candidatus Methylacidiphilales bacterium]|nr:FHA domain-containing protein [Candidatus Methylacidiphilales bacterium]
MPVVYKLRDLKTGTPYLVLPGVVTIGRHEDANIKLDDESISRRHAQIHNSDAGMYLIDVGSSNGTYIGADKVSQAVPIGVGSEIRFGNRTFRVDPELAHPSAEEETVPQPQISWDNLQRRTDRIPSRDSKTPPPKASVTRTETTDSGRLVTVRSASFPGGAMFPKVVTPSAAVPMPEPPAPVVPRSGEGGRVRQPGAFAMQDLVNRVPFWFWVLLLALGLVVGLVLGLVVARFFLVA